MNEIEKIRQDLTIEEAFKILEENELMPIECAIIETYRKGYKEAQKEFLQSIENIAEMELASGWDCIEDWRQFQTYLRRLKEELKKAVKK